MRFLGSYLTTSGRLCCLGRRGRKVVERLSSVAGASKSPLVATGKLAWPLAIFGPPPSYLAGWLTCVLASITWLQWIVKVSSLFALSLSNLARWPAQVATDTDLSGAKRAKSTSFHPSIADDCGK